VEEGASAGPLTAITLDLAKVRRDKAARGLLFLWFRRVGAWGLFSRIAAPVQMEVAALSRVPAHLQPAVALGGRLLTDTSWLMRRVVDGGMQFVDLPKQPTRHEDIVMDAVGRWLDLMRQCALVLNKHILSELAAVGGGGPVRLERRSLPSGVEACWELCCSLYNGISGGSEQPFAWLGLKAKPWKQQRPPHGRTEATEPTDLTAGDQAILLAMLAGAGESKVIAAATAEHGGKPVTNTHVRKRKDDLVAWGLLEDVEGAYRLTAKGEAWAKALQAKNATSRPQGH